MNVAAPSRIFVTGTDTGVGKTIVSAILTQGLQAAYWKPVQSGIVEGSDTDFVRSVTDLPADAFLPESYRLTEPLSPHAAASIDGVEIELDRIRIPDHNRRHLVIEGAGGVMVPLNGRHLMIDLIKEIDAPVLVVARSALGTINHTVLTVEALRNRGIEVLGVVMNGATNKGNKRAIEFYANVEVIAELPPLADLTKRSFKEAFSYFSWSCDEQHVSHLASVHSDEDGRYAAQGSAR